MPGSPTEADATTAKLVANFLRQLAGCDWSVAELRELADLVEAGNVGSFSILIFQSEKGG